jgi:hypothetical protein
VEEEDVYSGTLLVGFHYLDKRRKIEKQRCCILKDKKKD